MTMRKKARETELAPRRKAPFFVVRAPNSVWQLGEFMDLQAEEDPREKKVEEKSPRGCNCRLESLHQQRNGETTWRMFSTTTK